MNGKDYILVALGGALGSVLRYAVGNWSKFLLSFPIGTLAVNTIGSFLIGMLAGAAATDGKMQISSQLFLATGLCGGFTTFSAFSLETIQLFQQGKTALALFYILTSILLGLIMSWGGYMLAK